jgi:hypothetical protein
MNRYADALLAWCICIGLLLLELANLPVIRLLVGTAFLASVLYLLYCALTVILYDDFRLELRIALTIALFFSGTIASGILLNATPLGLTRQTWMASYTLIAGVALITTVAGRFVKKLKTPVVVDIQAGQILLLMLTAGLIGGAFALVNIGLNLQPAEGATQFWMMREGNRLPPTLKIGVFNVEDQPQVYTVQLLAAGNIIIEWADIELQHNEKWEINYTLPEAGIVYPLEAHLFIPKQAAPYRRTRFWLTG